jgi:hypothetical protein
MLRTAAKKVAWVGRTASMMFGLALVLALLFGVASMALGATGGNFILGKANSAAAASKLTSGVAGSTLNLINNGTARAATALNLTVPSGNAPLTVNSSAGKAKNLNSDQVDGFEGASFMQGRASQGKEAIPAGDPRRTILTTSNPDLQVGYECPSNIGGFGNLHLEVSPGSEPLNVVVDSAGLDRSIVDHYAMGGPNGFSGVSVPASSSGNHFTIQAQGANVATIEMFSFHRASDCHTQAQALVTR